MWIVRLALRRRYTFVVMALLIIMIVCISISIPLSILTSLIVLNVFGETINMMTLGGPALAIGILVDDATVEIKNIHRPHQAVIRPTNLYCLTIAATR
jgi:multidrug efflux pump subunit AcrB